ncbi:MAG: acyloxyacyl hydrolase [Bacteroidetes bacterium]|nr:acyloxyacyl hydrolase [Bacteroidota bacterium]
MALKHILCIGLALLGHSVLKAQIASETKFAISLTAHRGFLIAHRPLIAPLQKDNVHGLEGNIKLRTDGSQNWQKIYGYPEMGLSFAIWDLGNKEKLGIGFTVVPYLDFPLSKGNKHAFDLKFGWGIGYVEKTFDASENYKNVAIGSHLNCALMLQPQYKLKISEKLKFGAGLSLTHFSNGSITTPNLGINLSSITASIIYNLGEKVHIKDPQLPTFIKSTRVTIFGSGSVKQVYPAQGKNFFACTLSGNITRQKTRKSGIGGGADIFYDQSIHQKLEERDLKLNNSLETLKAGIHGSYELVISDVSLMLSMGGYLYTKLKNDGYFYHRIAVRYRINKKMFVCMNLKSHWGKADYIEWGIGFRNDYYEKNKN